MILHLISSPRNISTALMYSFAQRIDTTVMDEPFYACYLAKTGKNHPGREEILSSQSQLESDVYQSIYEHKASPILFIKNMAHHLETIKQDIVSDSVNIFLIRNPKQIIASYAAIIENPKLQDIGVDYQWKLFEELKKKGEPLVIDSGILLKKPTEILKKLCSKMEIKFHKSMLSWTAGPKPYDGIWAKYWYANVHKSSGFEVNTATNISMPSHLEELKEEAMYYYERLLTHAVR